MKNSIRAYRVIAGLTQAGVAEALGVGVPQVSRWESGTVDIPSSRLLQLAELLRVSSDRLMAPPGGNYGGGWVTPGGPHAKSARRPESGDDEPASNAIPLKMEGASAERMDEDLPIYGTALGAAREVEGEAIEQTTLNRAEVLQYAKRPVILNGNSAAYGLYVSGSSMEPRHMDGDLLLVDPKGRVRGHDDVVVYLRPTEADNDDGESARAVLVKRLLRRSSSYVELEQFHPAKVFKIDMADILRIDRVIPWQELLT